jgi:hypothetical protein
MTDPSKEVLMDAIEQTLADGTLAGPDEDLPQFHGSGPVEELAGLAARMMRLPKSDPPPAFTDDVMKRVMASKPSPWVSLWNRLRRPRVIRLNLLQALSGAAAMVLVLALAIGLLGRMDRGQQIALAPEAKGYVVRFTHVDPGAGQVYVSGSFNNWQKDKVPLSRVSEQGVWVGTLILPPGVYEYMFVVDGEWVVDPLARRYMEDGFGRKNALLYVADNDELKI